MFKDNKFTKIVATVGPKSRNPETLTGLIREGADVIRLNFSHGTFDDHAESVSMARKASRELNKPISIFQDLQGPKIRVGQLEGDCLDLAENDILVMTTEQITGGIINGVKKISIDYVNLHEEARVGNRILLDDGLLELRIEVIEGREITTRVMNSGRLKPRKGVNLPGIKLNISAITEKDRRDLQFAFDHELDFVALSFVRDADDVRELIDLMLKSYGRKIPIIAKIEKPEAFEDIDRIIETADAIMVARGDLGVETSPQEVPIIQKSIIRKCNIAGKPVITATQMLESMIVNPRPTRAEANDVANAILDGTDAVMLSAETAAGAWPIDAVKMMKNIALNVESSIIFKRVVTKSLLTHDELEDMTNENVEEAISYATIELASKIGAKYIVSFTHSGGTARKISKFRPTMPVVAFSPIAPTIQRLALVWGVEPMQLGMVKNVDELLEGAAEVLKFKGMVREDDIIVITAGVPVGIAGSTNMIKVVRIR